MKAPRTFTIAVNSSTEPAVDGSIDWSRVPPPLTPLYDSLTTNLPHPIMAYSAFPFPPSTPLFPKAEVVEDYLQDYAQTFGLYKHIRFNERVVKAEFEHGTNKWIVQTQSSSECDEPISLTYMSDLLLICNGHYNVPRYPRIPGVEAWLSSNRAAHVIFYRNPDCAPWKLEKWNKVLVVGGGPSGHDLVTDLIARATVIHSSSEFEGQNPEGVTLRGRLVKLGDVCQGEAEFEGGVVDKGIDFVIFATGYEVHLPFLADKYVQRGMPPAPSHVPPLQQGVWNTSYGLFPLVRYLFPFSFGSRDVDKTPIAPSPTSMFFLGLLVRVVPMPLVEVQARLALAIFANQVQVDWELEAREVTARYENLKAKLGEEGIHKQYFRFQPMEQFDYRDELVELVSKVADGNLVRRVKLWERELYDTKGVMRKQWRELEASGEAAEWVLSVGEGKTGKSAEEEWVELMRRVTTRSAEVDHGDGSDGLI
jgi:hypothetical protein